MEKFELEKRLSAKVKMHLLDKFQNFFRLLYRKAMQLFVLYSHLLL